MFFHCVSFVGFDRDNNIEKHREDGVPTDRPTDLPTDIVKYRAAEVQLNMCGGTRKAKKQAGNILLHVY